MHVVIHDGESIEQAIKRFSKGVGNDGTLRIFREKMRFQSKRDLERRKQARAARRRKQRNRPRS